MMDKDDIGSTRLAKRLKAYPRNQLESTSGKKAPRAE